MWRLRSAWPQASHEYGSGPPARGTGSNTSQGAGHVGMMGLLPQTLGCPSGPSEKMLVLAPSGRRTKQKTSSALAPLAVTGLRTAVPDPPRSCTVSLNTAALCTPHPSALPAHSTCGYCLLILSITGRQMLKSSTITVGLYLSF